MKKERKLRRLDFDLIQAEMSVIDGELLRSIVGGYSNDCFWRCIAYIEYGGCYTNSDVEGYAEDFFGSDVDLNTRKDGAAVTTSQMHDYATNKYGYSSGYSNIDSSNLSENQHLIIQFDLKKAGMEVGSTDTHAVLFREEYEKDGITYIKVYDPQKNTTYDIPKSAQVASILVDKNNNGGSGSGSGDYGSSSDYGSNSDYGSSSYYG